MGRGLIDSRGKGFQVAPGEPKWWGTVWMGIMGNLGDVSQAGTIDRVFLTPVWFPRNALVSQVNIRTVGAGAGGTNLRIGVYADNGGTPQGGELLETSGDLDATSVGIQALTFTPRVFDRGVSAWIALVTEDALVDFARGDDANIYAEIGDEDMASCRYQAAAPVVLDDPCPTVTTATNARLISVLRIDGWSE